MNTRLSTSSVTTYSTCGRKYDLRYNRKFKSKYQHGALVFGTAIDTAINHLLLSRNLVESIIKFDEAFERQEINGVNTFIPTATNLVFAQTDFDKDLLLEEDHIAYQAFKEQNKLNLNTTIDEDLDYCLNEKTRLGMNSLPDETKQLMTYINYLSLRRKGHIMIKGYHQKVLPKIKKVLAVQQSFDMKNADGDSIVGYIDYVAQFVDNKVYIMDNKTSTMRYERDSAAHSQQLVLYYYAARERYKADGVGFAVMYKNIKKNKAKSCLKCGFDGTGLRFKTCNNTVNDERCNGEWNEKLAPECDIALILNTVSQAAVDLVIETFDEANQGISNKHFAPNLAACKQGALICPYFSYCWSGDQTELVKG